MSEHGEEGQQVGVPDEHLPEDLVPGDDNPLAEGLPDGETVEGLLDESEDAQADEDDDTAGADGADGAAEDRSENG